MIHLSIVPNLENASPELAGKLKVAEIHTIGAMPAGMQSGDPSIGIIIRHEDEHGAEHFFYGETSLKLLLFAADTLKGLYGDPREKAVNAGEPA